MNIDYNIINTFIELLPVSMVSGSAGSGNEQDAGGAASTAEGAEGGCHRLHHSRLLRQTLHLRAGALVPATARPCLAPKVLH